MNIQPSVNPLVVPLMASKLRRMYGGSAFPSAAAGPSGIGRSIRGRQQAVGQTILRRMRTLDRPAVVQEAIAMLQYGQRIEEELAEIWRKKKAFLASTRPSPEERDRRVHVKKVAKAMLEKSWYVDRPGPDYALGFDA